MLCERSEQDKEMRLGSGVRTSTSEPARARPCERSEQKGAKADEHQEKRETFFE